MTVKFKFASLDEPFEAEWPVVVDVPQDGGTTAPQEFMARFRLLEGEAWKALEDSTDPEALFKTFFIGLGAAEGPVEDFPALRDKMLGRAYVLKALRQAYFGFAAGVAVKNSVTPPEAGS